MDRAWDILGYGICAVACIGVFSVLACVTFSDKKIEDHYLRTTTTGAAVSYQVMNQVNWCEDSRAFITTDADEALKVLEKLKGIDNE